MDTYRQCILTKVTPTGYEQQTSWIPEPYCKLGKFLKLRDEMGVWTNGWKVESISEPMDGDKIEGLGRLLKNKNLSNNCGGW